MRQGYKRTLILFVPILGLIAAMIASFIRWNALTQSPYPTPTSQLGNTGSNDNKLAPTSAQSSGMIFDPKHTVPSTTNLNSDVSTFTEDPNRASPSRSSNTLVIWPGSTRPTKVISLPDPQHPAAGVVDLLLTPSDDIEVDTDSAWSISYTKTPDIEVLIGNEDAYLSPEEYIQKAKQPAMDRDASFWSKAANSRFRLKPGLSHSVTVRITTYKGRVNDFKYVPDVPSQQFGNLSVSFMHLQGLSTNALGLAIDFAFQNTNDTQSIAVALYCATSPDMPEVINSSVIASDGTRYWCEKESVAGIRWLSTNRDALTEIGPKETRKVTLQYKSQSGLSHVISSFRFQAELVVEPDYRANANSRSYLPKTYNLVLDIPVKND